MSNTSYKNALILLDGREVNHETRELCPDEEKGCSARDLVIIESCRAENLLSNYIKYVMIG